MPLLAPVFCHDQYEYVIVIFYAATCTVFGPVNFYLSNVIFEGKAGSQ